MNKMGFKKGFLKITGKILKIGALIAGGIFLFRKKGKISNFFKSSNFFVAAVYGILFSLIALIYRLIIALNWIIQQAR